MKVFSIFFLGLFIPLVATAQQSSAPLSLADVASGSTNFTLSSPNFQDGQPLPTAMACAAAVTGGPCTSRSASAERSFALEIRMARRRGVASALTAAHVLTAERGLGERTLLVWRRLQDGLDLRVVHELRSKPRVVSRLGLRSRPLHLGAERS